MLVVFGTALVFLATQDQAWTPLRLTGLSLFVPSVLLWMVARFQLGNSFSVRAQAKDLVTQGLYSRIQNPIYLFGSTTTAGLILLLDKPWYLAAFVILIPLQVSRIRRERKALESAFGERYLQYRKQTWF